MKNRTLRVIIILVGLLVVNIEAAHAGISHKFKLLVSNKFSDLQLAYLSFGLLSIAGLSYVIFAPAIKHKGILTNGNDYFKFHIFNRYQRKKERVKKITQILKNGENGEKAHY